MKKIFTVILCIALIFGFVACSGDAGGGSYSGGSGNGGNYSGGNSGGNSSGGGNAQMQEEFYKLVSGVWVNNNDGDYRGWFVYIYIENNEYKYTDGFMNTEDAYYGTITDITQTGGKTYSITVHFPKMADNQEISGYDEFTATYAIDVSNWDNGEIAVTYPNAVIKMEFYDNSL